MKRFLIVLLMATMFQTARADDIFVLNESSLLEMMDETVPNISDINTMLVQSKLARSSNRELYAPNVGAEAVYQGTNEKIDTNVDSVTKNSSLLGLTYNQDFAHGLSLDASIYNRKNRQMFSNTLTPTVIARGDYYAPILGAALSVDLWKNFLGYTDRAIQMGLGFDELENELRISIEKDKFIASMRSIYWDMVINEKLTEIYSNLIEKAQQQLDTTDRMFRASVSDQGDVAKAKSTVYSRKSDLSMLKYQRRQLEQSLKSLIPKLEGKQIVLDETSLDDATKSIGQCAAKASASKKTPLQYTKYDEMIAYTDKKIEQNLRSFDRYSDLDVKLVGGVALRGYETSRSDAYRDISDMDRTDYSVGVNASIPLGSSAGDTKRNQTRLLQMQHNSQKRQLVAEMNSLHEHFISSMGFLDDALAERIEYKKNMEIRVRNMGKKYNQGRASISDLISDEDDLLQAEISLISTNAEMIGLALDYISVFGEIDCDFNMGI